MHTTGRLVVATIGALALLAQTARAVDITGSWAVCLSNGGAFCPPTGTGMLVSSGGTFTLTVQVQLAVCVVTGTVNSTTGELTVDDTSECPFFAGMTATATDTSISGSFSLLLCPAYTLAGVKACGTCDDASPCTVDGCGTTACSAPGSSCTYGPDDGGPCEDGDPCTVGGMCSQGSCASAPMLCNDGNPCTNDACQAGACVFTPNSNPCSDGTLCTTSDTCTGGSCVGTPVTCEPCERCGPLVGCIVGPKEGCRQSTSGKRSKILLKDHPNDAGDKVAWTWGAGEATTAADFGDPVGGDDYELCVFDGPPSSPRRMLALTAPGGGTCADGSSCWQAKGSPPGTAGFLYKDSGLLLPDGLKRVKLKPGGAAKAKAIVKGQGTNLLLPSPMNVTLPVTVQLQAANGECFETVFTTARIDREDLFKATESPSGAFIAP
jgi:hypothetical protein